MAQNVASQFQADVVPYLQAKLLPLARRQLVAYQFGEPYTLDKGRGVNYTATRYNRLPLPYAPLSEGVPPIGETMTMSQVTAVAQQWGDKVNISDVAEITIFHPLMKTAEFLLKLQIAETLERNTYNALMAGTQVNYVNSKGSRGALATGDVLDTQTVQRTNGALETLGAPRFDGDEQTDMKVDARAGGARASDNPRSMPHYVGICHTLVVGDWMNNPTVLLARSYSNLYQLYNYEIGEWSGIRFCKSNMVPTFTGFANSGYTVAPGTAGSLATGTYYVIVTGQDNQNQYESRIYAVSAAQTVTGPNGSLSVTVPNVANFTFNVYVGTTTTPTNLGLSASGPLVGPLQGQATQIAPGATAIITGTGVQQIPPASPAVGQTVYPTFIFGRGAYGIVKLDDVKFSWLTQPDKSDPLNQQLIIGWKLFNGVLIANVQFMARIESVSANSATFG